MRGSPLTPEETEMAIHGLAKRVAIDQLIELHRAEYNDLVKRSISCIKDQSENMVGADENDEA
jgi:hypothetical protein